MTIVRRKGVLSFYKDIGVPKSLSTLPKKTQALQMPSTHCACVAGVHWRHLTDRRVGSENRGHLEILKTCSKKHQTFFYIHYGQTETMASIQNEPRGGVVANKKQVVSSSAPHTHTHTHTHTHLPHNDSDVQGSSDMFLVLPPSLLL